MPTSTAPARRRSRCTSFRLSAFEIHLAPPPPCAPATLPSILCAHFNVTQDRPVAANFIKGALSRRASVWHSPVSTLIPAPRSCSIPLPLECPDGSGGAPATLLRPAEIIAGTHGPVLPW